MAAMFGEGEPIQNIYGETEDATPMQHRYPSRLKKVKGDGACLPRCFSLVIWGHERNHQFLRDSVVDILFYWGLSQGKQNQEDQILKQR